jgi:hypothetical protein
MTRTSSRTRSPQHTLTEKAFDRTLLAFVIFFLAAVVRVRGNMPELLTLLSALLSVAWLWALIGLIHSWREPSSGWLRFSAVCLFLCVTGPGFAVLIATLRTLIMGG